MKRVRAVVSALAVLATLDGVLLAGCSSMQPNKVQLDDTAITASVKSSMAADPGVAAIQVGATTSEGVVTLTGRVKTVAEQQEAVKIARDTNGVKKVNDFIKVGEMPATSN
jgi:hyperosmotically inducible protein